MPSEEPVCHYSTTRSVEEDTGASGNTEEVDLSNSRTTRPEARRVNSPSGQPVEGKASNPSGAVSGGGY
jgi:hypothetical protein